MKKGIDIKSLIIGVLVTALVFTIIGARGKNSANFDTITAKAIRIVNQKGKVAAILASSSKGNGLEIRNGKGKIMADLINRPSVTTLTLYSGEEKPACQLVSFLEEPRLYGALFIFNHGKIAAALQSLEASGGMLGIYNQHGKQVARFRSNKNGDGVIGLFDRYGNPGWAMKVSPIEGGKE